MNLILCGLPTSGKSSVGKILAQRLQWRSCDTDQLIEQQETSCRTLYLEKGEKHFRLVEKEVIARLHDITHTVIATGGGTMCDGETRALLRKIGCVVYLQQDPKTAWERLSKRGMPAYLPQDNPEEAFYRIAEERIPLYEAAAHLTINTESLDLETIATEVLIQYGK